jgi:hypothetical protein
MYNISYINENLNDTEVLCIILVLLKRDVGLNRYLNIR